MIAGHDFRKFVCEADDVFGDSVVESDGHVDVVRMLAIDSTPEQHNELDPVPTTQLGETAVVCGGVENGQRFGDRNGHG